MSECFQLRSYFFCVLSVVLLPQCSCCLASNRGSAPVQTSPPSNQQLVATTPKKAESSDFSPPQDCADVQKIYGNRTSGIYTVRRPGCFDTRKCSLDVLCDLQTDGGGWTIIQQRISSETDFAKGWNEYKIGFGNLIDNFWIGNDYIHQITTQTGRVYELLAQLEAFNNAKVTSVYDRFEVTGEEDFYRLKLGNLFQDGSGIDNFANSRNNPFGTLDRDTDEDKNLVCGSFWRSGWWHDPHCQFTGNLNVPYEPVAGAPHLAGIVWRGVSGNSRIRHTQMKIRPLKFFSSDSTKSRYAPSFRT